MFKWLLMVPVNIFFILLAFLTNWIVCFFADENGELPGFLKMWQTYDNNLDSEFFVKEKVPKFLRYDFDKHYRTRRRWDSVNNIDYDYTEIIDPVFTKWEKVQRYFCRVGWIMRNPAYGFAFFLLGTVYRGNDNVIISNYRDENRSLFFSYNKSNQSAWDGPFCIHFEWRYSKTRRFKMYLGWKTKSTVGIVPIRAQMALNISPYKPV